MSVMSSTRREYRMILITYLLSFSFGWLNEISYSGTLSLHLSQIFPNIFSSVPTLYQKAYWNWVQPAFVAATFQVKFFSIKRNAWKLPTYPHGQMKQIGAMFSFTSSLQFWYDSDDLGYRGLQNEILNFKIICTNCRSPLETVTISDALSACFGWV